MAFQIPSLADLVGRARSSFRAYLPGSDAWLWPNNLYATAKVLGGVGSEIFGFIDYVSRQKFSGTADGENLDLHAQEFGLARRAAQPASGTVTLTCTGAVTVAGGAVFQRADGIQYIAEVAASVVAAGSLDVSVIAASDGANTNANGGTPLEIVSGVTDTAGGSTAAVQTAGIVAGLDVEPDGEFWTTDLGTLRGRILFRKRNPPHGGAPADYVEWASSQSGVTRVFVEPQWSGAGTVRVFVLMDDLYPNGIPSLGDVTRIANYIYTVRPAGALVSVVAPAAHVVDVQVSGLTPNTTAVQEAVKAELKAAFERLSVVAGNAAPNAAMPFLAIPQTFSRSWIWQAVSNASGEQRHAIALPAADVALAAGEIAVLGTVTFV